MAQTATNWKPKNGIYWSEMVDEFPGEIGRAPGPAGPFGIDDVYPGNTDTAGPAKKSAEKSAEKPEPNSEPEPKSEPKSELEPVGVHAVPEATLVAPRETESGLGYGVPPMVIVWWPSVTIPKCTTVIFNDTTLYGMICDFCRTLQNIEINERGAVTRTLCDSCRIIVGRYELNACRGVFDGCELTRYVDEVGALAPLCRNCYQYEEARRHAARDQSRSRGGRRRRGATSSVSKSAKGGIKA